MSESELEEDFEEEDDPDDVDFDADEGGSPPSKKAKKKAKGARVTRGRASRSTAYREESEGDDDDGSDDGDVDLDDDDDDDDDDDGDDDDDEDDYGSSEEDAPKKKVVVKKPVAKKAAAKQATAQQVNRRSKQPSYKESDDEDGIEYDDDDDDDDDESEADSDDDGDSDDDDDDWGNARKDKNSDVMVAKRLDKELNARTRGKSAPKGKTAGRAATTRPSRKAAVDSDASWSSDDGRPRRGNLRATGKISYAEDDVDNFDDGSDGSGSGSYSSGSDVERPTKGSGSQKAGKESKEALPAFTDVKEMDDEVERVLGHRDNAELEAIPSTPWSSKEFKVKWKRYSHIHCTWEVLSTLAQLGGYKRVVNYMRKVDEYEANLPYMSREEQELRDVERQMEEQLNQQHSQMERVIAKRNTREGIPEYLVKWEGLPYSEVTWESCEDIETEQGKPFVQAFQERETRLTTGGQNVDVQRKQFKARSTRALEKQPECLCFGTLRDYQLDGLNWMVYSWSQERNVILADEMGLGKTIQCVSFLAYMTEVLSVRGPFLVVVPLSVVPNWIREFKRWAPYMNAVVYVGDTRSREVIRAFEFEPGSEGGPNQSHRFEVLITTYELVLKDANVLGKIKWAYMMVDEAHRLKNAESALYLELSRWHFGNKLLVTGTPLQNSLKELWALLHFLEPEKFWDSETFLQEYALESMDGVSGLHMVLRPHLLRRVIKEVEKSLPPKNERIIRVEMTPLQKQYYKWILTRNFKELNKGARGGGQISLLNVITELKKCSNHPFLFESAEEGYRGSDSDKSAVDRLILTSGKMVLLDKLLRRLHETKHRVLIFSQMVRALDIISDYMRLRGFIHQRLDGSTPAAARHQAMEQFNRPDSPDFAFLLSTRAGGLGINLATADTVIIFDSDWNPQNDLQAMSRAHRIGQTETVNIYRLVTSGSVEEDILERAKKKMVLDHLVIQRMDTSGRMVLDPNAATNNSSARTMFGKDELAAILRFGAEDLFKSSDQETAEKEQRMYEEDIDAILERAEVVEQAVTDGSGIAAGGGAAGPQGEAGPAELLSSFNVATFKTDEDDASFWSRLIPATAMTAITNDAEEELMPRSARLKLSGDQMQGDDDVKAGAARAKRLQQRSAKRNGNKSIVGMEPGPPVEGAILRVDEWLMDVDDHGYPLQPPKPENEEKEEGEEEVVVNVRTISRRDAQMFIRAARRYMMPTRSADVFAEIGSRWMDDMGVGAQASLWHALIDGCKRVVDAAQDDPKNAVLDFFGVAVKAHELLQHSQAMRQLGRRVDGSGKDPSATFRLDPICQLAVPKWGKPLEWSPKHDAMLLLGVYYHGVGHWQDIAADGRLHLSDKLAELVTNGVVNKDAGERDRSGLLKASHLETRVLGLLRKLYTSSKKSKQPVAKNMRAKMMPPAKKLKLPKLKSPSTKEATKNKFGDSQAARHKQPPLTHNDSQVARHKQQQLSPKGLKLKVRRGDDLGGGSKGGGGGHDKRPPHPSSRPGEMPSKPDKQVMVELLNGCRDDIRGLRKVRDVGSTDREVLERTKALLASIGCHIDSAVSSSRGRAYGGDSLRLPLWDQVSRATSNDMSGSKMEAVYSKIKAKQEAQQQEAGGAGPSSLPQRPPHAQQPLPHKMRPRETLGGAGAAAPSGWSREQGGASSSAHHQHSQNQQHHHHSQQQQQHHHHNQQQQHGSQQQQQKQQHSTHHDAPRPWPGATDANGGGGGGQRGGPDGAHQRHYHPSDRYQRRRSRSRSTSRGRRSRSRERSRSPRRQERSTSRGREPSRERGRAHQNEAGRRRSPSPHWGGGQRGH